MHLYTEIFLAAFIEAFFGLLTEVYLIKDESIFFSFIYLFSICGMFFVTSGKLGALRLKVRLVEDRILPSVYYQPLIHLLVESVISPAEVSFQPHLIITH